MKRLFLIPLLAAVVAACATANPQQTVFSATATYGAALKAAVAYESLPRCGMPVSPVVCSDPDIVQAMRNADNAAKVVLDHAQTVVRTPGFGDDVYESVAAAALGAASALAAIVAEAQE